MLRPGQIPLQRRAILSDMLWNRLNELFDSKGLARIRGLLDIWTHRQRAPCRREQEAIQDMFLPGLENDEPWFDANSFSFSVLLERAYLQIREEFEQLRTHSHFVPYTRGPHVPRNSPPVQGLPPGWKEIKLIHEFEPVERNRTLAPTMSAIADQILAEYKVVAQFTILALEPGTELPVHADMANFLVSCHMGIEVPAECALQVASEKRSWLEGKCIAFNNSYLHSAFNHSSRTRYTLVVHTLHPNTTLTERKALALIVSTLKSMSVQSTPFILDSRFLKLQRSRGQVR